MMIWVPKVVIIAETSFNFSAFSIRFILLGSSKVVILLETSFIFCSEASARQDTQSPKKKATHQEMLWSPFHGPSGAVNHYCSGGACQDTQKPPGHASI